MINCPNCSTPVREDTRFCGNCGIDVQAALAAQQQALAQAAMQQQQQLLSAQSPYQQPSQATYPLQTTNYGGYDFRREERSPLTGRLLIAGVLVIAVACAFLCGCLIGGYIEGYVLNQPTPVRPSPTAAPQGLLLIEQLVRFIV